MPKFRYQPPCPPVCLFACLPVRFLSCLSDHLLVCLYELFLILQLAMLYPFCFFGQMACGAVFGIVPFLSHRRSGLTVGVVAAGGNVGAAAMQVCADRCWAMHTALCAIPA